MNNVKLAIGTAQFGLNYGINNQTGQVSQAQIQQILAYARQMGVDTIDTAIAYGQSEQALGQNNLHGFHVITKLPAVPDDCTDVATWVSEQVEQSLKRLNIQQLDAVLLHRPEQLLNAGGQALYAALQTLKRLKLCRRIGVSVYSPDELDPLIERYALDIVQMPMNLFDQRALADGWLERLAQNNISVHVRSLFLQGLLLISEQNRPVMFNRWKQQWQHLKQWQDAQQISPLEACLRPFLAQAAIEKLVIGIDSLQQLKEITQVMNQPALPMPTQLACADVQLLNPSLWSQLS